MKTGLWVMSSLLVLYFLSGCAALPTKMDVMESSRELMDRFVGFLPGSARPLEKGSKEVVRNLSVIRRGRRERALVVVAPAFLKAPLGDKTGRVRLEVLATPVFNLGDGLLLDVVISNPDERRAVFRRYFDAGRCAGDREWIPIEIPLDLGSKKNWELELHFSAGPQGDLVGDWLAIALLRIVEGPHQP